VESEVTASVRSILIGGALSVVALGGMVACGSDDESSAASACDKLATVALSDQPNIELLSAAYDAAPGSLRAFLADARDSAVKMYEQPGDDLMVKVHNLAMKDALDACGQPLESL
jgi:hypothetical protein